MPKYQLTVNGENFLVQFHATHPRAKHGFCTKFLLEADTPEAAAAAAIDDLEGDADVREVVRNTAEDPPTLTISDIHEIRDWPKKIARPRIGLVWYPEEAVQRRKAPRKSAKQRRTLTRRCS